MKPLKIILCLLSFAFSLFTFAQVQDTTYCAKIVDAETGEEMPCVGIRVSNSNTTLTNFEGEFCIDAQPDDTIRITCIGHRTLMFKASQLPSIIRMEQLPGTLSEVTIRAYDGTMLQISRQMLKDIKRKKRQTAQYFYRQTSIISTRQDIVEAFVRGRSAGNLRELQFLSGRHGETTKEQWENSIFSSMNLHHVLELGAITQEVPFWENLLTPLIDPEWNYMYKGKKVKWVAKLDYYQTVYHIDIKEVNGDDQQLYRIELQPREDENFKQPVMVGTLYVDRRTLRTMSFDGEIKNMALIFTRSELESSTKVPVNLDLHIDYSYDNGYAEVADIGMQVKFDNFQTRTMLFNVEDSPLLKKQKKGKRANENMLTSIKAAGYDSIFWAENEIIKRTEEEQQIANGFIGKEQARIDSIKAIFDNLPPLEYLATRQKRFGQAIPQEKVYVQMDNTCYFLGDTIWFSTFTRRTDSGTPSRISRVLYVELLNHDGYLVERKLVEMQGGRGSGYFALPDTLYSGFFELRAYTRWQLNWGQTEHDHINTTEQQFFNKGMANDFFRDYEKLYSRVFPVYDKPREQGEFVRDMTLRPLRRQFKKDAAPPELQLSLFPEGGNLVSGIPCRVAFEAALEDGEVQEGTLTLQIKNEKVKIKNEYGKEVTEVRAENRGRGSFTFTPEAGQTYEAVFTSADGKTAKQKLKDIEKEGVTLQVRRENGSIYTTQASTDESKAKWFFDIHSNLEKPLGMTVMHEGVVVFFKRLDDPLSLNLLVSHSINFSFPDTQFPAGINQVTIFDEEGRVWADRLFFVTRPELTKPTLIVKGLKEEYKPFEEINLNIQAPLLLSLQEEINQRIGSEKQDSSIFTLQPSFSLAVRDAKHQDITFDSGNIMTEMLLASEIKGFVPQPEWFFEEDDDLHRRGLDLLMMTQGWRRFAWRDMAVKGEWEITNPAEHTQMVTGSVNNYYVNEPTTDEAPDFGSFQDDVMKKSDYRSFSAAGGDNVVGDYDAVVEAGKGFATNGEANNARNPKFVKHSNLKREVTVHAEFVPIQGGKGGVSGEAMTQQGQFKIDLPRFYGDCVFFLTAADTTKWSKKHPLWAKKYKQHEWIQMEDDEFERIHEDAEFYVRLHFPYPHWVKPYTYYQVHNAAFSVGKLDTRLLTDGTQLLNEVTIRARRNRLNRIDLHKPVYVIDAYEAGNMAMDAGLITTLHSGDSDYDGNWGLGKTPEIAEAVTRYLVSDMDMNRHFDTSLYFDSVKYEARYPNRFDVQYWVNETVSPATRRHYSRLEYIDKIYIYSDYSPRREGDERFEQSNQPSVDVSLHAYPDKSRRVTYRDRRYILHGFAYQEDFYHPNYKRNPPKEGQKDYRRTLYWNPDLKFNEVGEAHVTLYNNSQRTRIQVEANGMTSEGGFLYNKK